MPWAPPSAAPPPGPGGVREGGGRGGAEGSSIMGEAAGVLTASESRTASQGPRPWRSVEGIVRPFPVSLV